MSTENNRREFLKQGVAIGTSLAIGGICLAGCCSKRCLKSESAAESDIDFSRIAYCCINCDKCPLYEATLKSDDEAKKKIAAEWGDDKREDFKLEEFYCYGCKDKRSCGVPGRDCTVRICAVKKGFATCAHCESFEVCDNKFWRDFPQMRDEVRSLKAKVGIT
jgi:hypothetical protein